MNILRYPGGMINREDNEPPHVDVVLMGGAQVGKTAILHRMLHIHNSPTLSGKYNPTIEDSFIREFLVGTLCCRLRLIDTAGGYAFPAMQRLWVKKASAFIFVCARNDQLGLEQLRRISAQLKEERGNELSRIPRVLVVNKCDLPREDWYVQDTDVEILADEMEINYESIVCTSAMLNTSIIQIFKALWKQNEEAGSNGIHFDADTETSLVNRRSSAFAVLFGSPGQKRNSILQPNDRRAIGRPHAGSFSEALIRTRPSATYSNMSGAWLAKKFTKLHVGQRSRSNSKSSDPETIPTVIEMNCIIS
ncbi:GTP-binding protein Di-Ras2 [Fasciola hepatica]|uniref:GTP-binding protein Di-Ras2 n=1 Tax=Fasciola hepatica TaxID=6192 RepID=A0A4E0S165_FASHE|nr:GTP-binding protein Di-Ras2 [Fasciola hepatica]